MGRKLSFTGLAGSGGGGGGGGALNWWEDIWTKVAYSEFWIRSSSHTTQSSTTYQRFGAMKHKGAYGGIFDPWDGSNSGGPYAKGFFVNQTTGAVTERNGSAIWNHNYGPTFTTLHRGNVGNDYVVRGGCTNPSYGSNYRDWWYGARFSSDGNIQSTAYHEGSPSGDLAEHSNGDLAMAQDSVNGTTYFRKSGYNRNNSRYYHSRATFTGNGGSYNEWSNPSSNTSTNYCTSYTSQERGSNPYGCIWFYNSTGNGRWAGCYGNGLERGSDYAHGDVIGWHGSCNGFVLSNGKALITNGGKATNTRIADITNGTHSAIPGTATYGVLALLTSADYSQSHSVPRPTWPEVADSWMVPMSGKGYAVFKINTTTYDVNVKTAKDTLLSMSTSTPPARGSQMVSVTGDTNQYVVYADVVYAKAQITVYENPFKDADMS